MISEQFLGSESHKTYTIEKVLGKGGQGTVYLVVEPVSKIRYAAKWYNSWKQYEQIEELIKRGTPKIDDPGIHFIWPIESLTFTDAKGFGYLMPLIDTNRFFSPNQIIFGEVKQPNLPTLCRISYCLVTSLAALHSAGLAYCDINQGNIMLDPVQGAISVCDNDNVVVNNDDSQIKGVWEFMAPEVALGETHPNAESDLYSVAVLLFYLWVWGHPMEGKKTIEQGCWDVLNKKRHFAERPVFMFHPSNPVNTAVGVSELELHVERWSRLCPPKLKNIFTKAFVTDVHKPAQRERLPDWQRTFLELEANSPTCACGGINIWDSSSKQLPCWKCQKKIPLRLVLRIPHRIGDCVVLAYPGARLRQHHLDPIYFNNESRRILGRIEDHPEAKGHFILRNLSTTGWHYKTVDGRLLPIEPNQARALIPGVELRIFNHVIKVQQYESE